MSGRFLARWSRLKRQGEAPVAPPAERPAVAPASPALAPSAAAPVELPPPVDAAMRLPALETLGYDADYSDFLKKEVSESLRRAALQKLFSDPRFNRIDPLDIYIDDYTQSDPIPADMMQKLKQFETYLQDKDEHAPEVKADEASAPVLHASAPASEEGVVVPTDVGDKGA